MSLKILYILIFIVTNGFFLLNLFSQSSDSTLILDQLIQEMLLQNPELQSSHHRWQAMVARAAQAGTLPDPVLGIGLMDLPVNTFALNQEMMTGKRISLMQMFPFPGKQGIQKDIMLSEVSTVEQQYLQKKNELIKDLKENYFELFFIDQALASNQKNNDLLNQLARITETRYRLGKGLQQDVLKAQLALLKLTDNLIDLQQERQSVEARINFLLNRKQANPLPKTENLEFVQFEKELQEVKDLALENNPILKSWKAIIIQSNQKVKLAKKEYLPDFSVELAYTQHEELQNCEGGVDLLSVMVNLTLPLYFWNKQKKQVQESQLNAQVSGQMQESVIRLIFRELEKTYAELQKNRHRWQLFESSILPHANQTLRSSLAAYQVDQLEFLTVIDNQMGLYDYELESYRILVDYHKNLVELEFLVGTEIGQPSTGN